MGLAACHNDKTPSGGDKEKDVTINFYLDFNQLNENNVYQTYSVKNGSKLTEPKKPTVDQAPMPEFTVFLGWSYKEIIEDKRDLWDFSKNKIDTIEPSFNLFGIWVAEGEK